MRRQGLITALVAAVFALTAGTVRADEASGRWTGQVSLWGNYYWETSTRVEAPGASFRLSSPDGVDVHGDYLMDAITSASVAAGAGNADLRFTEIRNQGSLGVGHEFDLGTEQLRLDVSGRVSVEPDYVATGVTLSGVLSMAERCSLLGFSLGYIHDDVGAVIQGGGAGASLSNRGRVGQLEGLQAGIWFSQILTATSVLTVGYDLVHNNGFIQNAYRQVPIGGGAPVPEHHPDLRTRHSFYGRLAWIVPESDTAFHLMYRVYIDDWGVGAITPEGRIYQGLGNGVMLRFRYRYYNQTHAFFAPPIGGYTNAMDSPYVTADQKMMAFQNHLVGLHLLLPLTFLGESPLAFVAPGRFILSFDYYLQGSRFGDAVIAQAGVEVPF